MCAKVLYYLEIIDSNNLHYAYWTLSAMLEFNKKAAMWEWSPLFKSQRVYLEQILRCLLLATNDYLSVLLLISIYGQLEHRIH